MEEGEIIELQGRMDRDKLYTAGRVPHTLKGLQSPVYQNHPLLNLFFLLTSC